MILAGTRNRGGHYRFDQTLSVAEHTLRIWVAPFKSYEELGGHAATLAIVIGPAGRACTWGLWFTQLFKQ